MLLRNRNKFSTPFLLGLALVVLAGCGFHPLHLRTSPQNAGPLAQIRVSNIPDRIGQKFHNLLLERLNPQGEALAPKYNLSIILQHSVEQLAVQKSAIATRANLRVTATFALRDGASRKIEVSGTKLVVAGYDIMSSDYATLIAEKDAEDRALTELADEIRTQLAVYFNRIAYE
ncbi:LPS assembly lipoprotein LptE [Varunaivibrio sulfuroxidans]|uniref:LPS-assembly lipoprotein n=1 Tax=Varunaivibrio sulfuroxidans TaxID=1773489 RepID=A0A4R3JFD9_9PROT|nr:LPS assembly lipoprotein LptE [Varunaivibrio sulfuroxidans]TCS64849.1 LPS-assembly lipoprotein [Varunaivibrio sulfuroxidans]WES29851.1 LPS assembly lipoprotein LptE [Varunaivibrio sulfuroxidans]